MKLGLHIGKYDWPGSPANTGAKLGEIAAAAEAAGFASLWVMDHLFQLGEQFEDVHGPADAAMLEGYSTLAFLAARTERIRLGLLVTCPLFRQPGILIKTVSSLDVLSGGRAYLGLGAGWFEREARGLGIPFPPLAERYERLEETVLIAKRMWSGSGESFVGRHYRLAEPVNQPQPLTKPHPPILIGGAGERRTLRLVARHADAWNYVMAAASPLPEFGVLRRPFAESLAELDRKRAVLARHCHELGRDPTEIEKTVVTYVKLGPGAMSTSQLVEICGTLGDRGIHHVIFNVLDVHAIEPIATIGRAVIPHVQGI